MACSGNIMLEEQPVESTEDVAGSGSEEDPMPRPTANQLAEVLETAFEGTDWKKLRDSSNPVLIQMDGYNPGLGLAYEREACKSKCGVLLHLQTCARKSPVRLKCYPEVVLNVKVLLHVLSCSVNVAPASTFKAVVYAV